MLLGHKQGIKAPEAGFYERCGRHFRESSSLRSEQKGGGTGNLPHFQEIVPNFFPYFKQGM
jgi:hypothetical protein